MWTQHCCDMQAPTKELKFIIKIAREKTETCQNVAFHFTLFCSVNNKIDYLSSRNSNL